MNWLILNQPRFREQVVMRSRGVAQALWEGEWKIINIFYDVESFSLFLARVWVSEREKEAAAKKKYENEMNYDFQIEKWENLYLMKDGLRERTREVSGKSNQRGSGCCIDDGTIFCCCSMLRRDRPLIDPVELLSLMEK